MRFGIDMFCLAMYVDIRSKRWPEYGFWLYIFGPFARRIFSVYGSLGVFEYLGFLSDSEFKDSHLFPIAITAEVLALVIFGFSWQRREPDVLAHFSRFLLSGFNQFVVHADSQVS